VPLLGQTPSGDSSGLFHFDAAPGADSAISVQTPSGDSSGACAPAAPVLAAVVDMTPGRAREPTLGRSPLATSPVRLQGSGPQSYSIGSPDTPNSSGEEAEGDDCSGDCGAAGGGQATLDFSTPSAVEGGRLDDSPREEGWLDWQWDLLNSLPHDRATRILQLVDQIEAENARLQMEREAHLAEIRRLDHALEDVRDDASDTERQLTHERDQLRAAAERRAREIEGRQGLQAELERERDAREVAERRVADLEAQTAQLRGELRLNREAEERYALLSECVVQARALEAEALEDVKQPAPACASKDHTELEALEAFQDPEEMSPEELSITAWSCASLGFSDAPLMHAIAARLAAGAVAALPPCSLCDVAWAFAQQAVSDAPLVVAVSAAAVEQLDDFAASELWSLHASAATLARAAFGERASAGERAPLESFAAAAEARAGELRPGDLVRAAESLASLRLHDVAPLRVISKEATRRLHELSTQDLSGLARSLAALDYVDKDLLEGIGATLSKREHFEMLE